MKKLILTNCSAYEWVELKEHLYLNGYHFSMGTDNVVDIIFVDEEEVQDVCTILDDREIEYYEEV